jgi:glutathione S-transferase
MAPHIALHEIGAPFEARCLSFLRKDQRAPDYLALNPLGKVPLLVIDGRPLSEVAGILFYLARRFPEAGLLPDDVEAQAQAVSWMSYVASTLHPARRAGNDKAKEIYLLADRKLGKREWVLDTYSVADIHLFRLFWRFLGFAKPDLADYPNLAAHYARMMERPAVKRTIEIETAAGYEFPQ